MRKKRDLEIIAGVVASTGVPVGGTGEFFSARSSAGVYTVNFPKDFRLVAFVVSGTSNGFPAIGNVGSGSSANTGSITVFNSNTQAPTDVSAAFIAVGYRT